jgi:hypothetical protein
MNPQQRLHRLGSIMIILELMIIHEIAKESPQKHLNKPKLKQTG